MQKKTAQSNSLHDNSAEAISIYIDKSTVNTQRMYYGQAVHQNESLQMKEDKQAASKHKTSLPDPLKTGM